MASLSSSPQVRAQVFGLIARYGWNATAFQTLEAGYTYFFHGEDACVAYVDTGAAWVAAGAPIAATHALADTAVAFRDAARGAGRRCCFFATEPRFQEVTADGFRSFAIGQQPVWDPRDWPDSVARHASLREQLRRARAKGVRVRLLPPHELEAGTTRTALLQLADRWLATRGMAAMSFLVRLEPLTQPALRRCFVAERDGALIGFAGVIPVPAREGWFVEDLLRDRDAPNGTTELLVDAVIRWAAAEGCEWLTLGLAPLAGDVHGTLELARRLSKRLYDFDGLRLFKAKLRPSTWIPVYLSHPAAQTAFVSMFDALAAFAPGGLLRFGIRSLLRGPPFVLAMLAALLIPWTLALAVAPAEHWFGSPHLKWAWVAFDIALFAGLLRGLARPTPKLLTALALTVSADAIITFAQALVWNVHRVRSWLEWGIITVACTMPALAAAVLWGARRRSQRIARATP